LDSRTASTASIVFLPRAAEAAVRSRFELLDFGLGSSGWGTRTRIVSTASKNGEVGKRVSRISSRYPRGGMTGRNG
jgi:hypothetical protein